MATNLEQQLRDKKLTTAAAINKFLKGKKLKVIGNSNSHNYGPNGATFEVTGGINYYPSAPAGNSSGTFKTGHMGAYAKDFILIGGTVADLRAEKTRLQNEIQELEKTITGIDGKLDYLKSNNLEEYDEELFKVMDMLKVIDDNKLDKAARAKALMSLLRDNK